MALTEFNVVGNGQLLIFVHGVGLDRRMWCPVVDELKQEFTCVTFDLLGHGQAPDIEGTPSIQKFTERLLNIVEKFQPLKPILIGFSLGALVVKRFVIDNPDLVEGLVIAHSVFNRNSEQRQAIEKRLCSVQNNGLNGLIEPAIQRWFTGSFIDSRSPILESVRQTLFENNLSNYQKAYEVFVFGDRELVPLVDTIECPCFIITGENDVNSTPSMAHALSERIKSSKVKILRGLAHGAPIEAPKKFAKVIKEAMAQWQN